MAQNSLTLATLKDSRKEHKIREFQMTLPSCSKINIEKVLIFTNTKWSSWAQQAACCLHLSTVFCVIQLHELLNIISATQTKTLVNRIIRFVFFSIAVVHGFGMLVLL